MLCPESYESRTQGGPVMKNRKVSTRWEIMWFTVEQMFWRTAGHLRMVCHCVICLNPMTAHAAWG